MLIKCPLVVVRNKKNKRLGPETLTRVNSRHFVRDQCKEKFDVDNRLQLVQLHHKI